MCVLYVQLLVQVYVHVCLCAFLGLCMCTYRQEVATLTGEPEWDVNMDARVMARFGMG